MPIINNLPCGGSDVPSGFLPIVFNASINSTLAVFPIYSTNDAKAITAANLPTSDAGIIEFAPMKNFQAKWHLSTTTGISDYYTFEKGKTYQIQYYVSNSTYYFRINNKTDSSTIVNLSSSTNRWSNYLLSFITF